MIGRQAFTSAAALALLLASAAIVRSETPEDLEPYVAKARAAVKEMGGKLQEHLKSAIAAGGAVSAVNVGKTGAPSVATEQEAKSQLRIKRTALKVRNPANAPDDLERKVLEDFVANYRAYFARNAARAAGTSDAMSCRWAPHRIASPSATTNIADVSTAP